MLQGQPTSGTTVVLQKNVTSNIPCEKLLTLLIHLNNSLLKTYQKLSQYCKLENMAFNDVLPLKAARRDVIANLKMFLGHRTPET